MKKILCLVLAFLTVSAFCTEVPPPSTDWVNDFDNVFTQAEKDSLKAKLDGLHKQTGDNLIIVTIDLGDDPLEDFSMRLAEKWKVGKKGADNGLIYILAAKQRKQRLEVGYGLEGQLPDGKCKQLLMLARPAFKANRWGSGVDAVISGVIAELTNIAPAAVPVAVATPATTPPSLLVIFLVFLALFVFVCIISSVLSKSRGDSPSSSWFSGASSSFGGGFGSSWTSGSSSSSDSSSSWSSSNDSSSDSSSSSDSGGSFGGGGSSDSF